MSRVPLTIVGNAGAGKSKIWSLLTDRPYRQRASITNDEGYMLRPNNKALALTTIPGQTVNSQYVAYERYFRESRALRGVVFVASNGYDYVWPERRVTVLPEVKPYNLNGLRKRNMRRELDRFKQVCGLVGERLLSDRPDPPQWLIVVVNKLDLFWADIAEAEKYYLPGSGSVFDDVVNDLFTEIGSGRQFGYDVVPLACESADYTFHSAKGALAASTQLTPAQCDASVGCLAELLEERCGA